MDLSDVVGLNSDDMTTSSVDLSCARKFHPRHLSMFAEDDLLHSW